MPVATTTTQNSWLSIRRHELPSGIMTREERLGMDLVERFQRSPLCFVVP
jgi:hypothetical protein